MKKSALFVVTTILLISLTGCSIFSTPKADKVVIGGKNFTEQDILVYIMKDLLETKTNLKVEVKPYLGGTSVVSQALERGDLDIYPEYTGTALLNILGQPAINDPQAAYQRVKTIYKEQKKLIWLMPFGFNNTYTMTMRADRAAELGIETISDLVQHAPEMVLGSTHEFLERIDGYKGIEKVYGMTFKDLKGMDPGLTYAACRDQKADVIDAFATDGRIQAFHLKVLKDDKQFFPPYYAAPVIREDTLKRYPQIAEVLNQLAGKLDDKQMSRLNAQVDLEKKDPKEVARQWLKEQGLI